eukprot:17180-Pelagococcus_subviridis.AAC.2
MMIDTRPFFYKWYASSSAARVTARGAPEPPSAPPRPRPQPPARAGSDPPPPRAPSPTLAGSDPPPPRVPAAAAARTASAAPRARRWTICPSPCRCCSRAGA